MKLSRQNDDIFVGFRIKLRPSKNQIKTFERYFGMTRYFYNLALGIIDERYQSYRNGEKRSWNVSKYDLAKRLSELRKLPENEWMREYDLASERTAMFSAVDAVDRYNKMRFSIGDYYKTKRDKCDSTFLRSDRVRVFSNKVIVSSIGEINTERHEYETNEIRRRGQRLPYGNIMIVRFCGEYWLTGTERKPRPTSRVLDYETSDVVGIDINMSDADWIIDSNYIVVSKPDTRRIDEKIEILQRRYTHKVCVNDSWFVRGDNQASRRERTKREEKLRIKLQRAHRHRANMFKDKIYKYTKDLMMKNPAAIVMEDLSCLAMIEHHKEDRKYDKSFNSRMFDSRTYDIRMIMRNKCDEYCIPLIQADRTYPSTQLCSVCGHRFTGENKLKLSDRVYKCPECGSEIDRDLNSTFNLKYLGWSYLGDSNFPESHNEYKDDYEVLHS